MNLHPFLRLCAHLDVPSCCTSCALQPAAVVQHPCSKSFLILRHPLRPPKKPMQGKIKGRGTFVRVKPVCTWGWRGTRWRGHCAVGSVARWRDKARHHVALMVVNASPESHCE